MIDIYSTFAKDFIYSNNNLISQRKGGPAFFIENVFKKNDIKYRLFTGEPIQIKIQVIEKGESGTIESKIIKKAIIENNRNDFILISTISDEWILKSDLSKEGEIFLDVQGYVRAAKEDGSIYKSILWNNIFCMKGTQQEIDLIPEDIIERQKDKLLIITNGNKGCKILFKKKERSFSPQRIIVAKDTIGAGDTFFASFMVKFMHTNDITKSGNFAVEETEKFLASKNNEQN
ncbi:MAG: PfkB family carbohydrate kinase [Parcubacteria group bacterium]|jgi:hypothetical protein